MAFQTDIGVVRIIQNRYIAVDLLAALHHFNSSRLSGFARVVWIYFRAIQILLGVREKNAAKYGTWFPSYR